MFSTYSFLPASKHSGFSMEDYWVWCPSVARDDDGRYHMFASRWPKQVPFNPGWLTHSEVVRAVSDTAEGPYVFQEVVLPARGPDYWDGSMTHNPSIARAKDGTWLLYYTGTQKEHREGVAENTEAIKLDKISTDEREARAHRNQRIGLATAPEITGPWTRLNQPILEPRLDCWDSLMVTNPAPCVEADGSLLLLYKSVLYRGDKMHLGVCRAQDYHGPYQRLSDEPILTFGGRDDVEDPFVWVEGGRYHSIMKDVKGGIGGHPGGGIYVQSDDGVNWRLTQDVHAYSRTIRWQDGTRTVQDFLERPGLILGPDNRPRYFTAATATGASSSRMLKRSWNVVIPISCE
ncbi:glycoside hydrolase family protein [Ruficoccus sp. ZRK36]|uniref:glycoside hydrolase family protein n=1 Tax=Ruficoccus sp. ZRK36 TaxID=2866311 RepID=UPI001C72AF5D|nr:glycoside hydrolase family protein [Ruficoccus sp. ZRK36]QYY35277.1 glycoside hydrolase family protein [Ruficoccus sp. ZRK36]